MLEQMRRAIRMRNDAHTRTAYLSSGVALRRFTIDAQWGYDDSAEIEEIDVDAIDAADARDIAEIVLSADYDPDWRIFDVRERWGMYL